LSNHGAICCGETIEEAFYTVHHIVLACEAQLKLLPVGLDNLIMIPEETRKAIYDNSRKAPDNLVDNKEKGHVSVEYFYSFLYRYQALNILTIK
jgi:adducin